MKTIYKGRHYAGFIPFPRIHFGLREMDCDFMFTKSCEYHFKDLDGETHPAQWDWNKLFGLSWGLPHRESARIAWRYNPIRKVFEIAAFPYVSGLSMYKIEVMLHGSDYADDKFKLGEVKAGERARARIIAPEGEQEYILYKQGTYTQEDSNYRAWGFILQPYFGGKMRAPKTMHIYLSEYARLVTT